MPTTQLRPWRWSDGPGVLVEHADWDEGVAYAAALRRAGFAVLLCAGPDADGDGVGDRPSCPLLAGEECALVAGADVVVSALGGRSAAARQVTAALRRRDSGKVVVVDEHAGRHAVVSAVREAVREPLQAA